MKILIYQIQLYIPYAHSLKEKRGIIKDFQNQLQKKFNISIAEVDNMDIWQTAMIGICAVANEITYLQKMLSNIQRFIEINFSEISITKENIEFL